MENLKEKNVKPFPNMIKAGGLTKSPEDDFFFVFVCKGPKTAYKEVEEFVKGKTVARVIFQRLGKNYFAISEVKPRPIKIAGESTRGGGEVE